MKILSCFNVFDCGTDFIQSSKIVTFCFISIKGLICTVFIVCRLAICLELEIMNVHKNTNSKTCISNHSEL